MLVVEDEAMLSLELEAMLLDMGCVIVGTAAKLDDASFAGRRPLNPVG